MSGWRRAATLGAWAALHGCASSPNVGSAIAVAPPVSALARDTNWPATARWSTSAQLGRLVPAHTEPESRVREWLLRWWDAVRRAEPQASQAPLARARWAQARRAATPAELWQNRCANGVCGLAAGLGADEVAREADVRCEAERCTAAFRCPVGLCVEGGGADVVLWLAPQADGQLAAEGYDER